MGIAFPDEDSEYARAGTACHSIGSDLLRYTSAGYSGDHLGPYRDQCLKLIDANGVAYTEEMYDAAELYATHVGHLMYEHQAGGAHCSAEERVDCGVIHESCFGTSDAALFSPASLELFVWDLKFGFGIVEALDNWQMTIYTLGIISRLELQLGVLPDTTQAHLGIVQPRPWHARGPIRYWHTTVGHLKSLLPSLQKAAVEALSPNPGCKTGPHCRYCRPRRHCAAAQNAGLASVEYLGTTVPAVMSNDDLGAEVKILQRAKQMIEYRLTGLEELAAEKIKSGENVSGFRIERGYGRLMWNQSHKTTRELGKTFGVELSRDDVITPAQAVQKGVPAEVVNLYAERRFRGLKLVPDDCKNARAIFGSKKI